MINPPYFTVFSIAEKQQLLKDLIGIPGHLMIFEVGFRCKKTREENPLLFMYTKNYSSLRTFTTIPSVANNKLIPAIRTVSE